MELHFWPLSGIPDSSANARGSSQFLKRHIAVMRLNPQQPTFKALGDQILFPIKLVNQCFGYLCWCECLEFVGLISVSMQH